MTIYTLLLDGSPGGSLRVSKGNSSFTTSDFFNTDAKSIDSVGELPPVVRSISPPLANRCSNGEITRIYIIERKPTVKTITYRDYKARKNDWGGWSRGPDEDHVVEMSIPWQHYFLHMTSSPWAINAFSGLGVFFSDGPISGPDHKFYTPFVPNVFRMNDSGITVDDDGAGTGNVCLGGLDTDHLKSIADIFDRVYTAFWERNVFNSEASETMLSFATNYARATDSLRAAAEGAADVLADTCEYYDPVVLKACKRVIKMIAKIGFDHILDDDIFDSLELAFTFGEYLETVKYREVVNSFDFTKLFTRVLSSNEFKEDEPEPTLTPAKVGLSHNPHNLRQDTAGRWRRPNGTFASMEEIGTVTTMFYPTNLQYYTTLS